jgi:hypothetical protein
LSGKGGLVWGKSRNTSSIPFLTDTERGTNSQLATDRTNAEYTGTDRVTSFNSDGFALGSNANLNGSGRTQVAWTFRKAPGFFDIVTYTGDGVQGRVIPHDLNSNVGCVIVKRTDAPSGVGWAVWHNSSSNLALNLTSAQNQAFTNDILAATSTTFTVSAYSDLNASGGSYVAYLFAHDAQEFGTDSDESIIKCGSFTTTAGTDFSTDVTASVDLGFEPQWILLKPANAVGGWIITDIMRGIGTPYADFTFLGNDVFVYANTGDADTDYGFVNVTATGFNVYRLLGSTEYVYMAIRRPHKPASEFAATELYATAPQQAKVAGSLGGFRAGFVADFALKFEQIGAHNHDISCRLSVKRGMYTDTTNAEGALSVATYDFQDGMGDQSQASTNNLRMLLRRAPGFFDVVAYGGDGTNGRAVSHNLGVTPEMMWVKARDEAANWYVYHAATGATKAIYLNGTQAPAVSPGFWNDTAPTSSVFSVYSAFTNSSSKSYIAYLFASVDGISKVGVYTGTGNDLNVDCGFSAGARLVIIRRTDSTGDWYVWDSVRGIVAGNDPYLLLNSSAAQVTNTDYIDPLASGFTVTSSAPAALNASGGTYIFYAIA